MTYYGGKKDRLNIYKNRSGRHFVNFMENGEVSQSEHVIDSEAKKIIRQLKLRRRR